MWTFVDSINKLSSLLGDSNDGSGDMFPLAIRKKELNRGEWQLAVDAKCLLGYQSGTIDSSKTITLPTDWIETYILIINDQVISNNREIDLADWYTYFNWGGIEPYFYFWPDAAGTMNINILGQVENLLYKLYYFKKPTSELSLITDISIHQEEFREIPAYYAASELKRQVGQNAIADEYRAIYEAGVIKARTWSERLYVRKNYATPDIGPVDTSSVDRQGRSYWP